MTTHYIDITVLPDPGVSAPQLLGTLHNKLHMALVQHRLSQIGASFPGYSLTPRTLGTTLRLHGSNSALQQLMQANWLQGMRDHVHMTDIAEAPPGATHRTIHRKQFKTNVERLRRRRMRRKGETAEQATNAIPYNIERKPDLPYLQVRSHSTRQSFCLFIALGQPQQNATTGHFNSHGLSKTATIPWF